MHEQTTMDGFLNRRIVIEQPAEGYRIAVDTVLLAAAVPARAGETALDLGCGVGGAMLCLMCRVPGLFITGIEVQTILAELCKKNIQHNKFDDCMHVMAKDIAELPDDFVRRFDHVMMNPPYHEKVRHDISANPSKRIANTQEKDVLPQWVGAAARALKPSGTLTLIHRADRLDELLHEVGKFFDTIEVLPILPKSGAGAKRVIICARKGNKNTSRFCKEFILHKTEGGYTDEAEAVLRHMEPLVFEA